MYMTHFASQTHVGAALTEDVIVVLYFVFLKKISHINREINHILFLILSVPWMIIEFYKKLNTHTREWKNGPIQWLSEINEKRED